MTDKQTDILNRFKRRIDTGLPITYKELKKHDSSLLYAIERNIGSISKACALLNISENEMISEYGFTRNISRKTLTEEEIKERLLHLKSIGKLTTNSMRKEFSDLRLETSIKKVYGSVNNCLKHFGLERDRKVVTVKGLISEVLSYKEKGIDISYSNMIKINPQLVSNASNKFKSWNNFLESNSISFSPKRQIFKKETIKTRLDLIYEEYGELNYSLIKQVDSSLLFYAHQEYGNIEDFYIDMGYNPKDWMDYNSQVSKGRKFEIVFKDVLTALSIEHTYNKQFVKGIRPDFQLENKVWIDCKLSSWTSSTRSTVERYTPHCEKLIIVYLRGKKRKLYEYANYNVEFKKIDEYFPLLEEINRQDLISEIVNILNTSESVTTERLIP